MRQSRGILLVAMCAVLTSAVQSSAATFHCPSGDVACLTQSILAANANDEVNVINLAAGFYTIRKPFTIEMNDETGLPTITSS